jgi:uracil-DNA glycosylase
MTIEEYFKEWYKYIDRAELSKVIKTLKNLNKPFYPYLNNVFKAFELCPYNKLKCIWLAQDPYPNGAATGLAFANSIFSEELSPSLNILKEAIINFEIPHNHTIFAPDLEEITKQGILLLNSALTVEANKIGSHTMLWRPFIKRFIEEFVLYNPGTIWVLFGSQAQSFKPYIGNTQYIIEVGHPSYYARTQQKMPRDWFIELNKIIKDTTGETIEWYKEIKFN